MAISVAPELSKYRDGTNTHLRAPDTSSPPDAATLGVDPPVSCSRYRYRDAAPFRWSERAAARYDHTAICCQQ